MTWWGDFIWEEKNVWSCIGVADFWNKFFSKISYFRIDSNKSIVEKIYKMLTFMISWQRLNTECHIKTYIYRQTDALDKMFYPFKYHDNFFIIMQRVSKVLYRYRGMWYEYVQKYQTHLACMLCCMNWFISTCMYIHTYPVEVNTRYCVDIYDQRITQKVFIH